MANDVKSYASFLNSGSGGAMSLLLPTPRISPNPPASNRTGLLPSRSETEQTFGQALQSQRSKLEQSPRDDQPVSRADDTPTKRSEPTPKKKSSDSKVERSGNRERADRADPNSRDDDSSVQQQDQQQQTSADENTDQTASTEAPKTDDHVAKDDQRDPVTATDQPQTDAAAAVQAQSSNPAAQVTTGQDTSTEQKEVSEVASSKLAANTGGQQLKSGAQLQQTTKAQKQANPTGKPGPGDEQATDQAQSDSATKTAAVASRQTDALADATAVSKDAVAKATEAVKTVSPIAATTDQNLAVKPTGEHADKQTTQATQDQAPANAQTADSAFAAVASASVVTGADDKSSQKTENTDSGSSSVLATMTQTVAGAGKASATTATPTTAQASSAQQSQSLSESEFADTNHTQIVSSIKAQLLPNGGTMRMRLDPPELGVLQVTVRMTDGAMTASFETSNDQATKLLSHSLGQLKQALETQGVSVEKIHVQQTPRDQQSNANSDSNGQRQSGQEGQSSSRQEEQRREMLRRMWRRLGIGSDPLDMFA